MDDTAPAPIESAALGDGCDRRGRFLGCHITGEQARRLLVDLGAHLGSNLHEREVDLLIRTEWARSVEDIVWRRTKLGLRLTPAEIDRVAAYVGAVPVSRTA